MAFHRNRFAALTGKAPLLTVLGIAIACSQNEPETNSTPGSTTQVPCSAPPGQAPDPSCDDASGECSGGSCAIQESVCGSPNSCLPMGDNRGKRQWGFRLRRLNVVAPPVLSEVFFQNLVVTRNVDLNLAQCGEKGTGWFNWIFQFDLDKKTVTTGGAPPSKDPLGLGYCFARATLGGRRVEPVVESAELTPDNVLSAEPSRLLFIPIFLQGRTDNMVFLPISDARVLRMKVSDDGNCVGQFQPKALSDTCEEDRSACNRWKTAGALTGFISLEEADKVPIADLGNATLCTVLTRQTGAKTCTRDAQGKITAQGDYCSVTRSAGDCKDSFWLASTFAASAVKIHDGKGVAECEGNF